MLLLPKPVALLFPESSPSSRPRPSGTSLAPITPPPSPKEEDRSQSRSRLHIPVVRQSTATIHHRATVPHSRSASSSPGSNQENKSPTSQSASPHKPKIWSIADVMNSGKSTTLTPESSGQVSRPLGLNGFIGGSPASSSLGPARPHHPLLPGGPANPMVLTPPDPSAYSLACYQYGLAHPAFLASQRGSVQGLPGRPQALPLTVRPPPSDYVSATSRPSAGTLFSRPSAVPTLSRETTSNRPSNGGEQKRTV